MLRRREMRILVEKMGTADGRLLSGGDENTSKLTRWLSLIIMRSFTRRRWCRGCCRCETKGRCSRGLHSLSCCWVSFVVLWISLLVSCCCYSPIFDALLSLLLLPLRLKVPGQQRKKGESWGRVCDVIPTNTYNRTWALLKHFSLLSKPKCSSDSTWLSVLCVCCTTFVRLNNTTRRRRRELGASGVRRPPYLGEKPDLILLFSPKALNFYNSFSLFFLATLLCIDDCHVGANQSGSYVTPIF
jgi:hypothetical protein